MVKENQNTKLLINSGLSIGESGVDVTKRGRCWYIGWFILALITLLAQLFFLAWVVVTAIYIATNVSSWPLYDNQHDAKGIIAIGDNAEGIIAIGRHAYGAIAIGQFAIGIISIGQISIGLLFALGQVGGGLCWSIGQCMASTKVIYAQIGFGLWRVHKAQLGFNIISSIMKKNKLVTYIKCRCGYKRYNVISESDDVKCAVNGIMNSIRFPKYWPEKDAKRFAKQIHSMDIEKVIQDMVRECVNGRYHSMHKLNETEIQEVIDHVLEFKEEFLQIAMKNFPIQTQLQMV